MARCECPFRVMVDIHLGDSMGSCQKCSGVFPILDEAEEKKRAAVVYARLKNKTH